MIALGCMRLADAAVLQAAIAAGVQLLDTADAYCTDETDVGANERLLAPFAKQATVVTKGGLLRTGGAWIPDGRARHLAAAARASRARLGVEILDQYLLHTVDPKVELATSARALAKLVADGVAREVGVCNVNATQLAIACDHAPIRAVQVELHPHKLDALRGGVVRACEERGLTLYAHRPLGGAKGVRRIGSDRVLREMAARLGVTPHELVLAWLRSLSPAIVPLPGATRVATIASIVRAASLVLAETDRDALADHLLRVSRSTPRTGGGEVVLICGIPGAGKSTLANGLVAQGYARLNRDERGGTLIQLARALDAALASGTTRVVLDNTYASRAQRAPVIEVARAHGATVRAILLDTSLEDAQTNAAARMLATVGRLLSPLELRGDAMQIGPNALFKYRRDHEPVSADEGFDRIETVPFTRTPTPGTRRGAILELAVLRTLSPAQLAAWHAAFDVVVATAWLPGADDAQLAALAQRFGIPIAACTHLAGPALCWCRKPLPGLGLLLQRDHDLDLHASIHVGRNAADRGFAERLGVPFTLATEP